MERRDFHSTILRRAAGNMQRGTLILAHALSHNYFLKVGLNDLSLSFSFFQFYDEF